jgi:hypothetical protein
MFNESDFDTVDGCWYSIFALHHTNTIGEVDEFDMQDPAIQGELPFTSEDLDRVMARARDMEAWLGQFESSSGNPLSVVALVAAWPEGDTQTYPRLVTTNWGGPERRIWPRGKGGRPSVDGALPGGAPGKPDSSGGRDLGCGR